MASELVPIRFLRPSIPYLAGETAWFHEAQAAVYIKQGFGERDRNAGPYQRAPTRAQIMAQEEKLRFDRLYEEELLRLRARKAA